MIRTIIKKSEFKPIEVFEGYYYISFAYKEEEGELAVVTKEIIHDTPNINYIFQLIRKRYNEYPGEDSNPVKSLIDISRALEIEDTSMISKSKDLLLDAITIYDLSSEVNSFSLNGQPAWFDKVLRNSIERQILARQALGQETAPIAYETFLFEIPIEAGLGMLNQLEVYASDCYNQTIRHKAAVEGMSSIDNLLGYDYKTGYPEKLSFKLSE